MNYKLLIKISWITAFAIAMGYLESAVVIYLRVIYYPEGFNFPLVPMESLLLVTEVFREVATLVMLLATGFIAGKDFTEKFAYFIYNFAIWDIFYYVFLKIFLDWPESLLTWDILFLIPTTWTGPVIGPIILSLLMVWLALIIIIAKGRGKKPALHKIEWSLLITGSVVVILAFIWDYSRYVLARHSFVELFKVSSAELQAIAYDYMPTDPFNWVAYIFGVLLIVSGILLYQRRIKLFPLR